MNKSINGYEGLYTVDENGIVIAVKTGKQKKITVFPNGYAYVHLHKCGASKCVRVHRIVAEAFLPNPYRHKQVNHINGVKTDNRVQNLEWCDQLSNIKHAMETGLFNPTGESNPSAKLTHEQVTAIRAEYIRGSKQSGTVALSKKYGVSNVMIGKIVRNENWTNGFDPEKSQHRAKGDV